MRRSRIKDTLDRIIKAQNGTKLYTILKGDTLWDIAKKLTGSGSNYKQIAKLNNISNPNLIFAGKTIKVPVKTQNYSKPTKYILKPEELKIKLFNFTTPDHSLITKLKVTKASTTNKENTSSGKKKLKLYNFEPIEPFVSLYNPTTVNYSTKNNSTKKLKKVEENFIKNLYHKIPEDYRTPMDLLRLGNFSGLSSYINTAYNRKISDNYIGTKMNKLNIEKAKETETYRLSEPSTFDILLASPQKRTGILRKSISYMNVPYDLNVKDYKWHYRLRGDMNPVEHTYGMLAPIFGTMVDKNAIQKDLYNGIIYNPKTGELSVEPDLDKVPEGWLVNSTRMKHFNVKGIKKDSNGNLVMVTPDNKEYKKNFTAEYELMDGGRKLLNAFTDPYSKDPKTLGATAGGHFIISATPKKGNTQVRIIHGSLQQLSDAIDRLKANTNAEYVTVYPLDGGSFSMGYIPLKAVTKNGIQWTNIESKELNLYQNQNPRGSSGFMPVAKFSEIPDTTYITIKN